MYGILVRRLELGDLYEVKDALELAIGCQYSKANSADRGQDSGRKSYGSAHEPVR